MSSPSPSTPAPLASSADGATATDNVPQDPPADTLIDAILASLFQPGLNTTTQRLMNYSFYGLFLSLLLLAYLSGGNPHVFALLTLSIGLYGGVNWFLHELANLPQSAKEIQAMPSQADDASTSDPAQGATASESKKDL